VVLAVVSFSIVDNSFKHHSINHSLATEKTGVLTFTISITTAIFVYSLNTVFYVNTIRLIHAVNMKIGKVIL